MRKESRISRVMVSVRGRDASRRSNPPCALPSCDFGYVRLRPAGPMQRLQTTEAPNALAGTSSEVQSQYLTSTFNRRPGAFLRSGIRDEGDGMVQTVRDSAERVLAGRADHRACAALAYNAHSPVRRRDSRGARPVCVDCWISRDCARPTTFTLCADSSQEARHAGTTRPWPSRYSSSSRRRSLAVPRATEERLRVSSHGTIIDAALDTRHAPRALHAP